MVKFYDLKLFLRPAKLYLRYQSLRYARKTEPEIHLLKFLVRPGCVAIDGGANKGVYSWWLSRYCKTVHAFEPNPTMFANLRRAVPRNVIPRNFALSRCRGTQTFYLPTSGSKEHHTRGSLHPVEAESQTKTFSVECTSLDELGLEEVGFIKLDVEGAELDCLLGGIKCIQKNRPMIMAEVTEVLPSSQASLLRFMFKMDYEAFPIINGILTHLNGTPSKPCIERNCLFIPRGAPLESESKP